MISRKRQVLVLALIQAVSMGAMEMLGPFWPIWIQQLLPPDQQNTVPLLVGLLYTLPLLGAMLTAPFWGRVGDKSGHRLMLVRALLALGLCQLLISMTKDPWHVIVLRALQGMLAGFISAAQAYALQTSAKSDRTSVLSYLQAATAAGSMIGPLMGGLALQWFSFQSICLVVGLICLACIPAVLSLPDHPESNPAGKQEDENTSFQYTRPLIYLIGIVTLVQMARYLTQPFFAVYLQKLLQAPTWMIGAAYASSALTLALSTPFWARFFAGFKPSQSLKLLERLTWVSMLSTLGTALATESYTFIATRMLWGVWQGAILPLAYTQITAKGPDSSRGFLIGLANSSAKAGAIAGIMAGASIMLWPGISHGFFLVPALYTVAAITLRFIRNQT